MTGYKITSHAILGWIFLSGLAFDAFGHATEYNTFSNAFIHIHSLLWNYAPKAFRTGAKQLWWMGYSLPVYGIPSLVYKSNQCNSDRSHQMTREKTQEWKTSNLRPLSAGIVWIYVSSFPLSKHLPIPFLVWCLNTKFHLQVSLCKQPAVTCCINLSQEVHWRRNRGQTKRRREETNTWSTCDHLCMCTNAPLYSMWSHTSCTVHPCYLCT